MTKVSKASARFSGKEPEENVDFKYRAWRLGDRCVAHNAGVCLSCTSPRTHVILRHDEGFEPFRTEIR
jgi:hypothetical protein